MPNVDRTIDDLLADGWTQWTGGANPCERKRVRVITRAGREGYAISDDFWWGRHTYDLEREEKPENKRRFLPHPSTLDFPRSKRQKHNEIIAYKRDTETPITPGAGPGQFTTRPDILVIYRHLP